jgi:hypothetical protein
MDYRSRQSENAEGKNLVEYGRGACFSSAIRQLASALCELMTKSQSSVPGRRNRRSAQGRMLISSSGHKKRKEPDLPLDTPEQIKHSEDVDGALERRAERKTKEVALRNAGFQLFAKQIVFVAGLLMFIAAWLLWAAGETPVLAFGIGSGGLSGMAASVKHHLAKILGGN